MLSLHFIPFPELETTRLRLRQITEKDAAALFEMRSDKGVMQYIDRPLAKTIDDSIALIKLMNTGLDSNDSITWGIALKEKPAELK